MHILEHVPLRQNMVIASKNKMDFLWLHVNIYETIVKVYYAKYKW